MAEIFSRIVLTTTPTDWGPMHVAASPTGIVAAAMLATDEAFRADLDRRGFRVQVPLDDAGTGPGATIAARARDLASAFLDGEDVELASIPIDIRDITAWDQRVLAGVSTIPRGTTASYGEVARRIGNAGAARAVGGSVGRSPIGLFVPCHRVIAGDGTLGGYGVAAWGGAEAGLDLKQALLRLEGVDVRRR